MEEKRGSESEEPPSTRQPKMLNLPGLQSLDFEGIDPDDVDWVTLEDVQARARRPVVRLRRMIHAPYRRITDARRQVRWRWQRMRRGWAEPDWWSLDEHLCRHIGRLLLEQASHGVSYPPSTTPEACAADLRSAGKALLDYDPEDEQGVRDAQQALRWVADNLIWLWD